MERCPICWDDLINNQYKTECCRRSFHNDCINNWKNNGNFCPICKRKYIKLFDIDTADILRALFVFKLMFLQPFLYFYLEMMSNILFLIYPTIIYLIIFSLILCDKTSSKMNKLKFLCYISFLLMNIYIITFL